MLKMPYNLGKRNIHMTAISSLFLRFRVLIPRTALFSHSSLPLLQRNCTETCLPQQQPHQTPRKRKTHFSYTYVHRKTTWPLKFYHAWFSAYGSENSAKWKPFLPDLYLMKFYYLSIFHYPKTNYSCTYPKTEHSNFCS